MIQRIFFCKNCKKEMKTGFIHIDGEPTHLGIYVCPLCSIIDLPKDFVREMYSLLPAEQKERTLADLDYRDTHGHFPGERGFPGGEKK